MSDRELLTLAAKAAGMHLTRVGYIKNGDEGNPVYRHPDYEWNPLTDDGDALRLAVKLGLRVKQLMNTKYALVNDYIKDVYMHEPHGTDPLAATRRAIVRAAAEIGRAMK